MSMSVISTSHILYLMSNQLEMPQSSYKVEEDTKKDVMLTILSDKYCRAIIEATRYTPKSAMDLTAETKIPISTIYRRIQMLHDNKLLLTSGTISEDGKKLFLYKSRIKGICGSYDNGQIEVKLLLG